MAMPLEKQIGISIEASRAKIKKAHKGSPEMAALAFGQALMRFRLEMRLSQLEVAKYAEISQQKVCYWETGRCAPWIKELPLISKGYQVSVSRLLKSFLAIYEANN